MNMPASDDRSYSAFISYRHLPLDREAAVRIQKQIENYTVPKEYRDRTGGKRLGLCFRDEDELPASASLSESITYALDRSRFLIVICTPDLPLSRWCMAEISYFLQTHDRDHVLAVLTDGTPEQSFPDQLRFLRDGTGSILSEVEPLAANISGPNHTINKKTFKKETMRLIAAMLGCPFDALWQREHRARTNRLLTAGGVVLAAMAVFLGVVLSKNAQISRQNRELEQKMSSAQVDAGIAKLQEHDRHAALQNALDALESGDPEIIDRRAEKLLADALQVYSPGTPSCNLMLWQTTDIRHIAASEDGMTAFTADGVGNIYAVKTETADILWTVFLNTTAAPELYSVGNDRLLCKTPEWLTALSMKDGAVLWTRELVIPNDFQTISDDGSLFALLDSPYPVPLSLADKTSGQTADERIADGNADMALFFLDTVTGEEITHSSLPADPYHIYINSLDNLYDYGGDFSDDGSCFFSALPTKTDGSQSMLIFLSDLTRQGQISCIGTYKQQPDMVLGMATAQDNGSVYLAIAKNKTLYSAILYADSTKEAEVNTYDYTMPSPTGSSYDYLFEARPYLPMLTSDRLALLFSHHTVYVMERENGTNRAVLDLESPVRSAVWLDRDAEALEICTEDGRVISYLLTYGTDYAVNSYYSYIIPAAGISTVCRVYHGSDSIFSDYMLAVTADQPGHLLSVTNGYDPNFKACDLSPDSTCAFAEPTPSGDRVMLFYPVPGDDAKMTVMTVDIASGALCEKTTVDLSPYPFPQLGLFGRPMALDDSRFLLYGNIYGMDGSVTDKDQGADRRLNSLSAVLENGRLLYAYPKAAASLSPSKGDTALCWEVEGQEIKGDTGIESGLCLRIGDDDPLTHFAVGKNGWAAGWGLCLSQGDTLFDIRVAEKTTIVAQDTKTGEKLEFNDDLAGTPVSLMALSNREPLLACVYDTGAAVLYDLQQKTSFHIPGSYARGEVRQLVFSDSDNYLLVLTASGKMDCYSLSPLRREFSVPQCFPADSADLIDRFLAVEDPEGQRLILTAANESGKVDPLYRDRAKYWTTVFDTGSWEITAQPEDVCCWSCRHGNVLLVNGTITGTCKIYTLKDLTEWARSELGK